MSCLQEISLSVLVGTCADCPSSRVCVCSNSSGPPARKQSSVTKGDSASQRQTLRPSNTALRYSVPIKIIISQSVASKRWVGGMPSRGTAVCRPAADTSRLEGRARETCSYAHAGRQGGHSHREREIPRKGCVAGALRCRLQLLSSGEKGALPVPPKCPTGPSRFVQWFGSSFCFLQG